MQNLEETSNFKIYPNPNNGKFIVETEYKNPTLEIIDVSGRTVISKTLSKQKTEIFLEEIKSGFYIARLILENQIQEKKLILNTN